MQKKKERMEACQTDATIRRYLDTKKRDNGMPKQMFGLYMKATTKNIGPTYDGLCIYMDYIACMQECGCDASEIRDVFKFIVIKYYRFPEYWKRWLCFEQNTLFPKLEKVVKTGRDFIRYKTFDSKEEVEALLDAAMESVEKESSCGAKNTEKEKEKEKTLKSYGGAKNTEKEKEKEKEKTLQSSGDAKNTEKETNFFFPFSTKIFLGGEKENSEFEYGSVFGSETNADVQRRSMWKNAEGSAEGSDERRLSIEEPRMSEPVSVDNRLAMLDITGHTVNTRELGLDMIFPVKQETRQDASMFRENHDYFFDNPKKVIWVNANAYAIINIIGKGGSSKVYRVFNKKKEIYALKRVKVTDIDEEIMQGYKNEIKMLTRLKGRRGIIEMVDFEIKEKNNIILIVMEYGEIDLLGLLNKRKEEKMTTNFARFIWEEMLEIVLLIHSENVVHCDLKPANFVFVKGRLKIIDFGISNFIATGGDTTSIFREKQMGTLNYMSPESIRNTDRCVQGRHRIRRSADVWSLGCILYEIAFGRPPFGHVKDVIQKMNCILEDGGIEYPAGADEDLVFCIANCLERDAKKRYTVKELLETPFVKGQKKGLGKTIDKVLLRKVVLKILFMKEVGALVNKNEFIDQVISDIVEDEN